MAAFIRDDTMRLSLLKHERELAGRRAVLARVVAAGEEERRQIAAGHPRRLDPGHDRCRDAAADPAQVAQGDRAAQRLDELEQTVQLSIARLRHLIFELRPPALDLEGLGAALARLCRGPAAVETGMSCEVEDLLSMSRPRELRVILYRIAQEV